MIRKNEYYPLFIKIRRHELGVNSIQSSIEKITNKNLNNLYKQELINIDNLIIFLEFLKEFICVFSHKFKYENLVEEMFDLYSIMLDKYYNNEKKQNINDIIEIKSSKDLDKEKNFCENCWGESYPQNYVVEDKFPNNFEYIN